MRKTLTILIITLLVLLISITPVLAVTSFKVVLATSSTKVARGTEVVVTVSLKDFAANETGIQGAGFVIDYDKSVFEVLKETGDIEGKSGWTGLVFNPANGVGVLDHNVFMAENHEFMTIKFKARAAAPLGNTVIKIKDFEGSDAVNDIRPAEQSITVSITEATTPAPNTNTTPTPNTTPNTNTPNQNPSTGIEDYTIPAIFAVAILGLIGYVRYTKLDK